MSEVSDDSWNYEEIIGRFTRSEEALRGILEKGELLDDARKGLHEAELSIAKLDHQIADASSALISVATEMKDVARDMRDTMISVQKLQPELILKNLDDINKGTEEAKGVQQKFAETTDKSFNVIDTQLSELATRVDSVIASMKISHRLMWSLLVLTVAVGVAVSVLG